MIQLRDCRPRACVIPARRRVDRFLYGGARERFRAWRARDRRRPAAGLKPTYAIALQLLLSYFFIVV